MLCNSVIYLMSIPCPVRKIPQLFSIYLESAVLLVFTSFKQCKNQPRFYTSFEWQIWETELLSFCKTEVCSLCLLFIFSHYRMIRYQIIKSFWTMNCVLRINGIQGFRYAPRLIHCFILSNRKFSIVMLCNQLKIYYQCIDSIVFNVNI